MDKLTRELFDIKLSINDIKNIIDAKPQVICYHKQNDNIIQVGKHVCNTDNLIVNFDNNVLINDELYLETVNTDKYAKITKVKIDNDEYEISDNKLHWCNFTGSIVIYFELVDDEQEHIVVNNSLYYLEFYKVLTIKSKDDIKTLFDNRRRALFELADTQELLFTIQLKNPVKLLSNFIATPTTNYCYSIKSDTYDFDIIDIQNKSSLIDGLCYVKYYNNDSIKYLQILNVNTSQQFDIIKYYTNTYPSNVSLITKNDLYTVSCTLNYSSYYDEKNLFYVNACPKCESKITLIEEYGNNDDRNIYRYDAGGGSYYSIYNVFNSSSYNVSLLKNGDAIHSQTFYKANNSTFYDCLVDLDNTYLLFTLNEELKECKISVNGYKITEVDEIKENGARDTFTPDGNNCINHSFNGNVVFIYDKTIISDIELINKSLYKIGTMFKDGNGIYSITNKSKSYLDNYETPYLTINVKNSDDTHLLCYTGEHELSSYDDYYNNVIYKISEIYEKYESKEESKGEPSETNPIVITNGIATLKFKIDTEHNITLNDIINSTKDLPKDKQKDKQFVASNYLYKFQQTR